MQNTTIGFIGGGNMAVSLIGGLVSDNFPATKIYCIEPDPQKAAHLKTHFSIQLCDSIEQLLQQAKVIVLAVKPQIISTICQQLTPFFNVQQHLLISIAAGIRINTLSVIDNMPIVRSMPNTPALIQCGATALFANSFVTEDQKNLAESILRAVGITLWLKDEEHIDIVTALSGSGPAYFFLVIEVMQNAAQKLGLPADQAQILALQTAFGAGKMALESSNNVNQLRQQVTSPKGTTEAAIAILEKGHLQTLFYDAMQGAYERSKELSHVLMHDFSQ